jgi:arylsulfatase I/J
MARPHIVFVMADDLGFNGVGYHNAELHTPALNELSSTGLRLESFYAYRLCGPSRASLLTGRMPYKLEATRTNLIEFWEESGTELEYTLLPEHLRKRNCRRTERARGPELTL